MNHAIEIQPTDHLGTQHAELTRQRAGAIATGSLMASHAIELCGLPEEQARAGVRAMLEMLIDAGYLVRFNGIWSRAIDQVREDLKGFWGDADDRRGFEEMSEQKHTPGPWKSGSTDDGGEGRVWVVQPLSPTPESGTFFATSIDDTEGAPVCFAPFWDDSVPDYQVAEEASIRLITAAPDLLEACKAVATDSLIRGWLEAHDPKALTQIQTAIAKAESAP